MSYVLLVRRSTRGGAAVEFEVGVAEIDFGTGAGVDYGVPPRGYTEEGRGRSE